MLQDLTAIPPPPPPPGPMWGLIIPVCTLGAAAAAFGVWMILGARNAESPAPRNRLARWRNTLTPPTRMALGLAAVFLGYHAASWVCPESWLPARVPPERWYFVVLGAAALIAGSLWIDRRGSSAR